MCCGALNGAQPSSLSSTKLCTSDDVDLQEQILCLNVREKHNFRKTQFQCSLDFVSQYKYLGVMLKKHFDLSVMIKAVAKSASRALELVIANIKFWGVCHTYVFKNVRTH